MVNLNELIKETEKTFTAGNMAMEALVAAELAEKWEHDDEAYQKLIAMGCGDREDPAAFVVRKRNEALQYLSDRFGETVK